METVIGVVLALAAYLLGSVSPSYLLVRLMTREDIRESRSRNAGTLNTYHRLGLAGGVTVLVLDAGKGALAVIVPTLVDAPEWAVFATALLVLVGHCWPLFLGFRGGKGAAVLLGVSLGLFPLITAVCLVPVAVSMLIGRNVVLGAALGYLLVCLGVLLTDEGMAMAALAILLAVVAGSTYLLGFRAEILAQAKAGSWRRILTFRFID